MRPLGLLAALMILAGAALLIYGIIAGEMQVALLLIVPVIYGSSTLGILAIGLIIVGVLVLMADLALSASAGELEHALVDDGDRAGSKKAEFGGVVLIGPVPIIFGSNRRMTILAIVVAVAILMIMILSLFYSGG